MDLLYRAGLAVLYLKYCLHDVKPISFIQYIGDRTNKSGIQWGKEAYLNFMWCNSGGFIHVLNSIYRACILWPPHVEVYVCMNRLAF